MSVATGTVRSIGFHGVPQSLQEDGGIQLHYATAHFFPNQPLTNEHTVLR
jgi:hypothetical protein